MYPVQALPISVTEIQEAQLLLLMPALREISSSRYRLIAFSHQIFFPARIILFLPSRSQMELN
jgi:hypothetical protein